MMNGMRKYTVPAEVPGPRVQNAPERRGVEARAAAGVAGVGRRLVDCHRVLDGAGTGRAADLSGGIGNVGRRRNGTQVDKEVVTD